MSRRPGRREGPTRASARFGAGRSSRPRRPRLYYWPPPVRPASDTSASPGLKPGSFRDPESRVFYADAEVFRALSSDGLSDFQALEQTGLLADERLVRTERAEDAAVLRGLLVHEPAGVLRHERIPVVSY